MFLVSFISCSKDPVSSSTPDPIPNIIEGTVKEFTVTPIDINTPDKGTFFISYLNVIYKVDFAAIDQAGSNAILRFASDTILNDQSREFSNLGKDAIAYNPLKENNISILFHDGRRVTGLFDINTSFGGVFGEALINQWRTSGDPAKPTQKAKDDIIHFVRRYADKDGPGPQTSPLYLSAKVSKN
jgi:hypothetical protein